MLDIIRCLCSSSNNNNNNNNNINNNETEADQPGPAQLVGVQSAPLPSPGLEVNTPALCQHPQVARHHGDLVQLLARGREHGYQGLPADIQLEEGLRRWPE